MNIKDFLNVKWILWTAVCFFIVNVFLNLTVGVTQYTIETETAAEEELRIAQLSDVHLIRSERWKDLLLAQVENEKPDLVVLSGDLVDSHYFDNEQYRTLTVRFCEELCKLAPVYYVYGNHEYILLQHEMGGTFIAQLKEAGVQFLNNEKTVFEKNGKAYVLLGIEDPSIQGYDPDCDFNQNKTIEILNALTEGLDDTTPRLLFAHRPELLSSYGAGFGIDLVFTGHAHGGQVRIPGLERGMYAPGQGFLPKYTAGIYTKRDTRMVVSRGIGNSRFPIRIFNQPEIVMIEFRA